MRKFFTFVLISLFAFLLAASAPPAKADLEDIAWTCPDGFQGQTLSIYNWSTYIGETTISDFEQLCGVTVTYDVYDSNEAMIARLRRGNPGYDIAIPSDYAVTIMIRDELIQPINVDNIPNFANVGERWQGLDFDPENEYSVPYLWGTFGVAYNVNAVGEEITSWEQVFNYDGPVAWIEDSRSMLGIALRILGYNPNTTDPDEIAEARDFLIQNGSNVVAIAADDGQALLARGEVDIALEYNGDIYQIIVDCECDDFNYVLPEEGSVVDVGAMVVLTGAPNPALAEVFIDYILDPYVSAQISNFTLYATANQAAIDLGLVDQELIDNPAISPDEASLENLFFLEDVDEAEEYYNDAWDEVTISVGS